MNNNKIETIVEVCERCNSNRLQEIVETVCGMNVSIEQCSFDRPTYVDMVQGTLDSIEDVQVEYIYNALHELKEF